jgi:dihydroorotate dehydrogenase electron transfer subunit
MIQEIGVVREIQSIRPTIIRLVLDLPAVAKLARPGQFLHLLVPRTPNVLLRRPFSIAGIEGLLVHLLIRIVGPGTQAITRFAPGSPADVIGPLGATFRLNGSADALLVGGGIGAAPLLFLQDELIAAGQSVVSFIGAKTLQEYPLSSKEVVVRSIIAATDDGTYGEAGFVTKSFEDYLRRHPGLKAQVFSCGPVPLMKEVSRLCRSHGLPLQVSMENRMGCGIGICQGCALKLNKSDERGGFRLICKDGPVFDAADIDWSLIF